MTRSIGRYRLEESLARGGMGDVWTAHDPLLERRVVVKQIRIDLSEAGLTERFRREARAAAGCGHPGIVSIFDFGEHEGRPFLVMEFVDGRSLADRVREDGPFDVSEACALILAAARAVAHAHDRGVVHRDLTPGNVLVDRDGEVRVLDFGLVRDLGSPASEHSTYALLGTPVYMAPEQAFGASDEVDGRVDVYGLGATLYELLAGKPPFAAPTLLALLRQIEEADAPSTGRGAAIDAVVAKAMAKEPEDRYASVRDLIGDLEPLVERPEIEVAVSSRTSWFAIGAVAILGILLGRYLGSDPGEASARTRYAAWSEAFGLSGQSQTLDLVMAGDVDEAASLDPSSPASWVALHLCSTANLVRYAVPGLVTPRFEAPEGLASDPLAMAGFRALSGDPATALQRVRIEREAGRDDLFVDLVELHAHLLNAMFEDDLEAARAFLAGIDARAERGEQLGPLADTGLIDLLRAFAESDEWPRYISLDREPASRTRAVVQSVLLALRDEPAEALALVHEFDIGVEPITAWFRALLIVGDAIESGERPDQRELEELVQGGVEESDGAVNAAYRLLMAANLVLEEDEDEARRQAIEATWVLTQSEDAFEHLPESLAGLAWSASEGHAGFLVAASRFLWRVGDHARAHELLDMVVNTEIAELDDAGDRRRVRMEVAFGRALLEHDDPEGARDHLLESLRLGMDPDRIRDEHRFEELLDDPELERWLR